MGRPGKKHVRLGLEATGSKVLFPFADDPSPTIEDAEGTSLPVQFDVTQPEESYARLISPAHRKRFGQYFTPQPIANLLCRWASENQPRTLLDPSAGTGILARTFHQIVPNCSITTIELDPLAASALSQSADSAWKDKIACLDFLKLASEDTFDAIVANPPYLRHHDICYDDSVWRGIEQKSRIRLSRLTNIYVLFILEICRRLNVGGRAAIIVPGEWLNANFGTPLKEFLLRGRWLKQLVYFSHAETLFPDALTTACLLLIEHPKTQKETYRLRTLFVPSSAPATALEQIVLNEKGPVDGIVERWFAPDELLNHAKWNSVLENGLPEPLPGFVPLAELATTCRGIATGANSFFHLSLAEAQAKGLSHLKPCIGRARDVSGYIFQPSDFANLIESNSTTQLWCAEGELLSAELRYLAQGEQAGLPERYLLSKRSPWYTMERREPAPIWAAVFGRSELRFVFNEAGILNLTTFHAIYPRSNGIRLARALTACLNSPSVQEKAKLQHRVYGGGLLKFEPRDLLEIQVPDLRRVKQKTLEMLDNCLASLDAAVKAGDKARCESARNRLNETALRAAAEAQAHCSEPGDQSELGPLWAQRKRRADQDVSPGAPLESQGAESRQLAAPASQES